MTTTIKLSRDDLEEALAFASLGGYDQILVKTTGTEIGTKVEVAADAGEGYNPRWADISNYACW